MYRAGWKLFRRIEHHERSTSSQVGNDAISLNYVFLLTVQLHLFDEIQQVKTSKSIVWEKAVIVPQKKNSRFNYTLIIQKRNYYWYPYSL